MAHQCHARPGAFSSDLTAYNLQSCHPQYVSATGILTSVWWAGLWGWQLHHHYSSTLSWHHLSLALHKGSWMWSHPRTSQRHLIAQSQSVISSPKSTLLRLPSGWGLPMPSTGCKLDKSVSDNPTVMSSSVLDEQSVVTTLNYGIKYVMAV
jgi:hypothetical protein